MAEMAILGTVALLALSLLIRVGLNGNFNQEIMMATFRRAMIEAAGDNTPTDETDGKNQHYEQAREVTYHQFRARQMANPSDGFGLMMRQVTGSNAHITWSDALTYASSRPEDNLPAISEVPPDSPPDDLQKTVVRYDRCQAVFSGYWGEQPVVAALTQQTSRTRTTTQKNGKTSVSGGGFDSFSVDMGHFTGKNCGQPQTVTHDF